ncbi:TPA: heterodisulfide reductase [Candidatus Bathyarchaeota archaeon]|nr:heterodisulfide reductase [Candidatus Bathyarchaeota archaeon]
MQSIIKETGFTDLIKSQIGGETIAFCQQCGTCASSCPVVKLNPDFNPRRLIQLSLLEEKKEVTSGESIWLCCSCYNCQERCPQKVEIADLILALRNIAIKEGKIPNLYKEFAKALWHDGRIVKISKFVERKRQTLGLPPLHPTGLDPLRKILSAINFTHKK